MGKWKGKVGGSNALMASIVVDLPVLFSRKCYGDPRDLHSFPTRRSSDLAEIEKWVATAKAKMKDASAPIIAALACTDRKSTRLNSSHVETSYAVFCLKKKIGRMEATSWRIQNACGDTWRTRSSSALSHRQ